MGAWDSVGVMRTEWTEVVDRARAGDIDAQGSLLTQFAPLVRATASRLVAPDEVDDVVQETFAVALVQLANLRTVEAFPAWLRLIVRKQAHRHRRARIQSDHLGAIHSVEHSDDPAVTAAKNDIASLVRIALGTASDVDRRLLELRYLAGWSNSELATQLGISTGAVRKRLHDARKRLRPELEHLNPKDTPMNHLDRHLGGHRLRRCRSLRCTHRIPVRSRPSRDRAGTPAATAAILYSEPDDAHRSVHAGSRLAAGLAAAGRDVVLLIDGATLDHLDPSVLQTHAGMAEGGSVTLVALRPVARGDDPPAPLGLDTTLVFSIEQFALGIFPAIDPAVSTSALPGPGVAAALRDQLERAAKVRSWFHQDLFVAADFTGREGTWVEPDAADEELRALIR